MFSLNVSLERQKAKLNLQLTRTEFTPGDAISGILNINVMQNMKITAVRLEIRAKEHCDFKVKGSNRVLEEFVHFQQEITFFGFSKMSGRKGGAELAVGSYQYPFQVQIPPTAPPSYYFKGSLGSVYLDWKVKATIVIPNSPFDAKEEVTLTVFSAVAKTQYDKLTAQAYKAGTGKGAIPASSSCCGGSGGEMSVDVCTYPRVVMMHRARSSANQAGAVPNGGDQYYPGESPSGKKQPDLIFEEAPAYTVEKPQPDTPVPNVLAVPPNSGFSDNDNALTVRVKLSPALADANIKKVRVILYQFAQVSGNGHSFCDLQKLAGLDIVLPNSTIKKGQHIEVDAHLQLGDMMRLDKDTPPTTPLPSIATKMFESSLSAVISFPGSSIADEMTINNVGYVFGVLDLSNRVPGIPTRYVAADIKPEEALSGV